MYAGSYVSNEGTNDLIKKQKHQKAITNLELEL